MEQISLAARTAARWWADQLRGGSKLDMGADSRPAEMAEIMGQILQRKQLDGMQPDSINAFEEKLAEAIDVQMANYGRATFGVDYHPDMILADAAEAAGLQLGMATLPWKTHMWVEPTKVEVSAGYGAPAQEVPFLTDEAPSEAPTS